MITTTIRRERPSLITAPGYVPAAINGYVAVTDRESPWNVIGTALESSKGTGTSVASVVTAADALRITGLDKLHVVKYGVRDEDGNAIPRMGVTGYDDPETGERHYFAAVSDKYKVVQPTESLSYFDGIIDAHGGAHYSSVWNLREKSMMGVTIAFPEGIVVDPGGAADEIGLYFLGVNSFDGSTGLAGHIVAERFWCMNQLTAIIAGARRSVSWKHTEKVLSKVALARDALGVSFEWAANLDKAANDLYAQSITDRQFFNIVKDLSFTRLDGTETDLIKGRIEARRDAIMATWDADYNENVRGTRWGAYNVLCEAVQWGRKVNGSPRTGTDTRRQRAIGTMVNATVHGQFREIANRFFN